MRNRKARAFTLTEVMVVIAIIGVVAAITFPVVSSMKNSAKITQTLQNLKSLHAGAMLYQADYHGALAGTIEEMGLPDSFGTTRPLPYNGGYIKPWYAGIKSPFRSAPNNDYSTFMIPAKHDGLKPTWSECTKARGDACIMYWDRFEPGRDSYTGYWIVDVGHARKRLHGIALAGNIVTRDDKGDPYSQSWWIPNFYEPTK